MIIGTAGHIDHGKTALVKALTGVEGDRLKEERARGVTIDLGFAYLRAADGTSVGFVDVPGHERFVHTMLAGSSGIDFALMVVAADDGPKPQTAEHLAIIDILGIRRGLVALTKCDLAAPSQIAAVTAEVRTRIAGTALADAPILPVSSRAGTNIDELRDLLLAAATRAPTDRPADSRFRLAVDRAFTLQGVGVVVTGTILSGTVHVDDRLTVSPSGLQVRVRSLHAQNRPADTARAGERCALNLGGVGVSKDSVSRGDVVLDPALHAPTDRIDASLTLLSDAAKPLSQWIPARLHHAAAEVGVRVVLLRDGPLAPGDNCDVQLVLDRPIAAASLDRYVLRDVSAQKTVGGGRFIDLRPPARRRRTSERRAQRAAMTLPDAPAAYAALLEAPPLVHDLDGFARDRALAAAQVEVLVAGLGPVVIFGRSDRMAMAGHHWTTFTSGCRQAVAAYHADHPDHQGVGRERLRQMVRPTLPAPVFPTALQMLAGDGEIVIDGSFVRLSSHRVQFVPADKAAWESIAPLLGGDERYRPPRVRDIAVLTGRLEAEVRRVLKLAGRMGLADEIARDHFFRRQTTHAMVATAAELAADVGGAFTAAQFRDRLANGRKVAIQILDFLDQQGITLRAGDLRRMDRRRLDLFATPAIAGAATRAEPPPHGPPATLFKVRAT